MAVISRADIAYNNFGVGDSYNTSSGWTIGGTTSSVGQITQGDQFTSLTSGTLVSVTVAFTNVNGTNSGNIALYNDSGANTIGSQITNWSFGSLPAFGDATAPPTVLTNGFPSITLTAGNKYWIVADVVSTNTWDVFNENSTGASGLHGINANGGGFTYDQRTAGAFRVVTAPVPEPATMAALGLGFVAMLRRKRK